MCRVPISAGRTKRPHQTNSRIKTMTPTPEQQEILLANFMKIDAKWYRIEDVCLDDWNGNELEPVFRPLKGAKPISGKEVITFITK